MERLQNDRPNEAKARNALEEGRKKALGETLRLIVRSQQFIVCVPIPLEVSSEESLHGAEGTLRALNTAHCLIQKKPDSETIGGRATGGSAGSAGSWVFTQSGRHLSTKPAVKFARQRALYRGF